MSEAIIIFLIAVPILHFNYHWVPYWSYFAIALGICLLFSFYTRFTANYAWYLLSAPLLFVVYYVSGYPVVMGLAFSIILVWRYIFIRREGISEPENVYLSITLLLSIIVVLMDKDTELFLIPFFQLVIVLFGYLFSHFIVVKKEVRKKFDHKIWLYILGVLAVGTTIIVSLFDVGRFTVVKIWEGVSYLVVFVAGKVAWLFHFIHLNKADVAEEESMKMGDAQPDYIDDQTGTSLIEASSPYVWTVILIILIGIVVFLAIRVFKNKFHQSSHVRVGDAVTYSYLDDKKRDRTLIKKLLGKYKKKPEHPVRKMVFQFERKAARYEKGRQHFETIEDWLERMNLNVNLDVYQKVRYGEMDVTDHEIKQLMNQLKAAGGRLGV